MFIPYTMLASTFKYANANYSFWSNNNNKNDLFYCHFAAQPKVIFFSFKLSHLLV